MAFVDFKRQRLSGQLVLMLSRPDGKKRYLTFSKLCFILCPPFQLLLHKRYNMYWQTLTTQSLCFTKKLFQSLSFRYPKLFILGALFYVFSLWYQHWFPPQCSPKVLLCSFIEAGTKLLLKYNQITLKINRSSPWSYM